MELMRRVGGGVGLVRGVLRGVSGAFLGRWTGEIGRSFTGINGLNSSSGVGDDEVDRSRRRTRVMRGEKMGGARCGTAGETRRVRGTMGGSRKRGTRPGGNEREQGDSEL